jgi:hypothetical protein
MITRPVTSGKFATLMLWASSVQVFVDSIITPRLKGGPNHEKRSARAARDHLRQAPGSDRGLAGHVRSGGVVRYPASDVHQSGFPRDRCQWAHVPCPGRLRRSLDSRG